MRTRRAHIKSPDMGLKAQNVRFQTFCAKELANRCPPQPANFFKSSSKKNLPNHLTYWYFDSILTKYAIYIYIYTAYISTTLGPKMASFGNNLVFSRCLMFDEFARFNISEQGLTELPPWVVLGEKKKTFRPATAAAWCISVSPVGKRNFHTRRCWLASRSMSPGGATKTTKELQEKGIANVKCEARNGVCRSLESY